jgi:hypothetical protein
MITNRFPPRFVRVAARFHTQPEILPVFAARSQVAVAVDIDPLAAKGLTEKRIVEGRAAGEGGRVEGFEGY